MNCYKINPTEHVSQLGFNKSTINVNGTLVIYILTLSITE